MQSVFTALFVLSFSSFFSSPFLSPLPLRLRSGSFRPCHCLEPVRLLFWLLARFIGGCAPSACVVRCPHGSTMRSATMSCVYSTHHSLHALNSLPSQLQRILFALSSLLLLRALLGPQLLFLLSLFSSNRLSLSLFPSPCFSLSLFPSPCFFLSRLLRSPLFFSRLLRSALLLSRLLRSPLFLFGHCETRSKGSQHSAEQ